MIELFAHVTPIEVPGFSLAALVGFVAGVAVTYALVARKLK
jgi:hypothetical protein